MNSPDRGTSPYELGEQYARAVQEDGCQFGKNLPDGGLAIDPLEAAEARDLATKLRDRATTQEGWNYYNNERKFWGKYARSFD